MTTTTTTTDDLAIITLPDFLSANEIGLLSLDDRRLIVRQATAVLEHSYAMLGFKVARYGINPLQRLRLLADRLDRPGYAEPEWRFHAELVEVFNSLHDLHTRYILPRPFDKVVAYVPFLLKEFTQDGRLRYLVGRREATPGEIPHPAFVPDVEITHWNGVPIARAVERFAERFPGANPEACHARAVDRFTFRSLAFGAPPDEETLTIRFIDLQNRVQVVETFWLVAPTTLVHPPAGPGGPGGPVATDGDGFAVGIDVEADHLARIRTRLFAPEFIAAEVSGRAVDVGPEGVAVSPEWATIFEARPVEAGGREFGHVRIRRFGSQTPLAPGAAAGWIQGFVNEFIRLLGELPQDGVVVDIRGNPGGFVLASELCLQVLTGRPVEPEPAQLAATALNLRICRTLRDFDEWKRSTEQALESGSPHSAGVPLTPPWLIDLAPQSYFGPVVLLTDARCYSAADIFAAGFQDNGIGDVLGTDNNIGAGGGNVWQMSRTVPQPLLDRPDFPFDPLPGGADLTFVIRRLLRVGPNAGTPLEDYGLRPKRHHVTTRDDLLRGEADLMAAAAEMLDERPPRRFDVDLSTVDGVLTVRFATLGVDRADVIVDGRPLLTVDLGGNPAPTPVPVQGAPETVQVIGFDNGNRVALRTFVDQGDDGLRLRTAFAFPTG